MKVGDIIRGLRKQHGMTQAELAKRIGTAPTTVAGWEQHKNKPLIDKIVKMSEIFDKPVEYFFGDLIVEKDSRLTEQESRLAILNKIESITKSHGYDLNDPSTLEVLDDFFHMLKRIRK